MRIGVLYPAPDAVSPANWSGIPGSLAAGLAECGADVVPVGSAVAPGLRTVVAGLSRCTGRTEEVAARMGISRWACTRALAEQLSRARPLDAVVVMGAELYDLPAALPDGIPVVTFDDATMAQQARDPYSDVSLANIPARLFARSAACQRAANEIATMCCVTTRWAAESFEADYGIPPEKIVVTGMGHRPRPTTGEHRDWSSPRFLFVGAEWNRKNGAAVKRAFEAVREQRPDASLDLVGDHPRIAAPGVTTHGFLAREDASAQQRLDRLYATATAFVLPSRFDAAGIVYLEAASSGLPVIATARGGAPDVLDDGVLVVDPYDHAELVAAMLTLSDPDTARAMGDAARRAAASSSWRDVAGRLLDALESRITVR